MSGLERRIYRDGMTRLLPDDVRELALSGALLAIYASARATAVALGAAQRLIV